MKNGSPKELYAISGMTIENMLRLAGMGQQAMNVTEGFNYLVEQRARGNVHFISGLYPESERKKLLTAKLKCGNLNRLLRIRDGPGVKNF